VLDVKDSEREETKNLTQDITAEIFHKVIAAVDDKPIESKEHLK